MNALRTLLAAVTRGRIARNAHPSQASLWAQSRFRHSMLGESGLHEAARLYGVGR
jgi:hypothetical protein